MSRKAFLIANHRLPKTALSSGETPAQKLPGASVGDGEGVVTAALEGRSVGAAAVLDCNNHMHARRGAEDYSDGSFRTEIPSNRVPRKWKVAGLASTGLAVSTLLIVHHCCGGRGSNGPNGRELSEPDVGSVYRPVVSFLKKDSKLFVGCEAPLKPAVAACAPPLQLPRNAQDAS